jgi:hypothetical protein
MQLADRLFRHREPGSLRVDQVQRIAVTTDLLLIAVPQRRLAEYQRPDSLGTTSTPSMRLLETALSIRACSRKARSRCLRFAG